MDIQAIKKLVDDYKQPVLAKDLPNNIYHSPDCPGLSSSFLKEIHKHTPLHAVTKRTYGSESSDAMTLGSLVHTMVLTPENLDKEYFIIPDDAPNRPRLVQINAKKPSAETIAAISFWDKVNTQSQGKTIITTKTLDVAQNMSRSVLNKFGGLLNGTDREHSIFYRDENYETLCKIRPDAYNLQTKTIIDLKTTGSLNERAFNYSVRDYGYHFSAAMYCYGMTKMFGGDWERFLLLAVEKAPPYDCRVFELSKEWLLAGWNGYCESLDAYTEDLKSGQFHGYDSEPTILYP